MLALVWAEIAISEMVVSVGERDVLKVVETFAFAKGEIVVLVEELAFPLLSIVLELIPRTWKVEVVPFVFPRAEMPVMLANGWLTKLGSQYA